jgi:ribosomal protein S18 acetylase RimI-like enzyme
MVDVGGQDRVLRLEQAMLNSWPSLSVIYDRDWVLRQADGYTKRANSVTCLGSDDADLDRRIDRAVDIYRARELPTIFRLSPLASPALEAALADRGWRRFDETIVLTTKLDELASSSLATDDEVEIDTEPDEAWLKSCDRIDGASSEHLITLRTMLQRLVPPAGFGRVNRDGGIDALALMVVDGDHAGAFEVLTKPEKRRQGLARRLLAQLLVWSLGQGAKTAWLSVLAHNRPALRLYENLGFSEVYRYYHRAED